MENYIIKSKPHFPALDGLRGVAALMVVAFHIMEASATSHFDQIINHGYLAVDFFFMLSGFVIGYAYDDRWNIISVKDFFKRRLIRLQPMVVVGMIIGATCFYFQECPWWPNIHEVPVWKTLLFMLIGFTLIPVTPSMDIRGWSEMHPLNGPGWSLFFEYIANILYGLFIRKFPKILLGIFVFAAGAYLLHFALTNPTGDMAGGWSLDTVQMNIGFARLLFPFFGGLLLFRMHKKATIKHGFIYSSLVLIILFSLPRFGTKDTLWMNGLYESIVIMVFFPVVVLIGAADITENASVKKVCKFLGEISYPIYMVHYPFIYMYTAWVLNNKVPLSNIFPMALLTFVSSVAVAYAALKWIDEPVRKWLGKKYLNQH